MCPIRLFRHILNKRTFLYLCPMKIEVNGQQIDTYDSTTKIKVSVLDITNPTARKAYKTEQIKIPASERNRAIIGEFDSVTSIIDTNQTAKYTDNVVSFTGTLLIYEAVTERNGGYYNIQIVTGNGDWAKTFEGKSIKDYDFSGLNHTYNYANITGSWSGTPDYVYPLVDYGKFHGVAPIGSLTNTNVGVHDMLPAVNVYHILQTIFNAEGYNFDDNTAEDLSDYYLLSANPNIFSKEDANNAKFNASIGGGTFGYGYNFSQSVPASSTVQLDLKEDAVALNGYTVIFSSVSTFDSNYDNGSNLNTSTGVYTVPTDGTYEFAAKLRLYLQIPPASFTVTGDDIIITVNIRVNGVTVASNTFTRDATSQGELIVKDKMREYSAGDTVDVYITTNTPDVTNNNPAKAQTISLSIQQGEYTFFEVDTLTRPGINHGWTYSEFMPDISVLDFLRGVFHLFNIVVITEPDFRNVRLYNYDGFYLNSVGFTKQIDRSKPVAYGFPDTPYISNVGYAIDGNDNGITNKLVKYTMSNGEDTEDIINKTFANTHVSNSEQIGYTLPILHNNSTIEQMRPYILPSQTFEFLPRILHFGGVTASHSWTLDRTAQSTLPVFDTTNIDIDSLKENYNKMQYQRNNGRILKCNVDINGNEINNILKNVSSQNIRKKVDIDDVQYIINTLEYNEKNTTKAELLRWHPVSTGVTIETVTITSDTNSGGGTSSGGSSGSGTTTEQNGVIFTEGDGTQYTIEYDSGNFGINYCINQSTGLQETFIIHSVTSTQAVISTLVACEISWKA